MIIARVALMRRMPRRIDVLDYSVPEGLSVSRGDLVLVPFRSLLTRAVVISVGETEPVGKLRPLTSLLAPKAMSETDLRVFETTAKQLVQSTSTVLREVFTNQAPRPSASETPRPSIRQTEVPFVKQAIETVRSTAECFIEVLDFVQAVALVEAIRKTIPGPHRVFVPHHHDAALIDGAMTRLAGLELNTPSVVDIVVRSGIPEHASYDRNPRYDAREILALQHKETKRKLVFIDVAPRVVDLAAFETILQAPTELIEPPQIIDLVDQKKAGFTSLLTEPILAATTEALQSGKSVLLSLNRKGVSTGLRCKDCGFSPLCKSCGGSPTVYEDHMECHRCGVSAPIATSCAKCGSVKLTQRGVGNQQVKKRLQELFPGVEVVVVEKPDKKSPAPSRSRKQQVIIATRYYLDAVLNPLDPPSFGLVADVLGDIGLSDPAYTAGENVLHHLLELRGVAYRAKCPFLVQTWDKQLMDKMLLDPHGYLEEERALRKLVSLPPYGILYKLTTRGETTIEEIKQRLHNALAGLTVREHTERKHHVLEILIPNGRSGNLPSVLKQLPDDVIIERV